MKVMRLGWLVLLFALVGCQKPPPPPETGPPTEEDMKTTNGAESGAEEDRETELRLKMVEQQLAGRDITNERVLEAMRTVPRHEFIPGIYRYLAYQDSPAPIGHDQTISQPYIVGIMSQLLEVEPGEKILEVGTGSGYQAAVLAEMGAEVYSIEIVEPLCEWSSDVLGRLDYDVTLKCGDGYKGWSEHAPYDGVIVTAAPPEIPEALVEQLKVGGRMVVPVGKLYQQLKVLTKTEDGLEERTVFDVRFVPMVRGDE